MAEIYGKFWAVWGVGRSGPTAKHLTEADAVEEANRLAGQTGGVFHVLEAVGTVRPMKPPVEYKKF